MIYFPFIRGRQYDLLALKECLDKGLLSDKIIPIIEPVKASPTLFSTLETFARHERNVGFIQNPRVGYYMKDYGEEYAFVKGNAILRHPQIIQTLYADEYPCQDDVERICISTSVDDKLFAQEMNSNGNIRFNLVPDCSEFRRSKLPDKVILTDNFHKMERNSDYAKNVDEFFSSDHIFCEDEGYCGFADYSIIGADYQESGFAPVAVAIHVVYFDNEQNLRVHHFVSDTNTDISNTGEKYAEALGKLAEFDMALSYMTEGLRALLDDHENKRFHGLGVVKKYTLMHHFELMSRYLDGRLQ